MKLFEVQIKLFSVKKTVFCVHVLKFLKIKLYNFCLCHVSNCTWMFFFSRSMSTKKSRIYLKCNRSLHDPEEARFILLVDNPRVGVVGQREQTERWKIQKISQPHLCIVLACEYTILIIHVHVMYLSVFWKERAIVSATFTK